MIRVTIELDSAITGKTTTLGVMCIANDGTGSNKKRNYDVAVVRRGRHEHVIPGTMPSDSIVVRRGRVENYPALALNVWRLICRALKSAFPEEDKC